MKLFHRISVMFHINLHNDFEYFIWRVLWQHLLIYRWLYRMRKSKGTCFCYKGGVHGVIAAWRERNSGSRGTKSVLYTRYTFSLEHVMVIWGYLEHLRIFLRNIFKMPLDTLSSRPSVVRLVGNVSSEFSPKPPSDCIVTYIWGQSFDSIYKAWILQTFKIKKRRILNFL